jgi:hypothetical protein
VVNASLNWASIVGIVLAVGGALLYFMRSFKPALARDYDVFFAAVGLLCGGILFFQGWRLDPILQFGQFLLAGTTVFFAYESVRLRGITTEQARRSSFFEDEEPLPPPGPPRTGLGGRDRWDEDPDRFAEPQPLRRRIRSREEDLEEDFYRQRRSSRPAIPERAVSRRLQEEDWDSPRRPSRQDPYGPDAGEAPPGPSTAARYTAGGADRSRPEFGARRLGRDQGNEPRRGTRPVPSSEAMPRSSRRPAPAGRPTDRGDVVPDPGRTPGVPQGTPVRVSGRERPADGSSAGPEVSDADFTPVRPASRPSTGSATPRDNSSRFDD